MVDDIAHRLRTRQVDVGLRIATLESDIARIVAASSDSNADDEHDPEGATIAFERAQLVAIRDDARRELEDLERALALLEAGGYGRCAGCGQGIGAERLLARPSATHCIGCASRRHG